MQKHYKNAKLLLRFDQVEPISGDLVVDDGKIIYVGKAFNEKRGKIVDVNGSIIMPAFTNAFCDASDLCERDLEKIIKENYIAGVSKLKIKTDLFTATKKILEECGLNYKILVSSEYALKNQKEILKNKKDIEICVDPYELDENMLDKISDFALSNDLKTNLKMFDSLEKTGELNSSKRMLPIDYVESFGLLDKGGTLIGAICSDKEDYQRLSSYDFDITINPVSDLRKANGLSNIVQIENAGLNLNIGTGQEKYIDFFREGRTILLGTKGLLNDPNVVNEHDVFRLLTSGREIKEGQQVDLILIKDLEIQNDIVADVINQADRKNIEILK